MTEAAAVRCSADALAREEPLAATAPLARAWLILEQRGPWGSKALTSSHLDPALGSALTEASAGTGTTVLLARRPGPHADVASTAPRRFWVACTAPGAVSMRSGVLDDPRRVLDWDLAALPDGRLPDAGSPDDRPTAFVCTNARRDLCCALLGRTLCRDLAGRPGWDDRVWECSHLGGHRFAATALLLPWGHVHGRLDSGSAGAVLDAAGAGTVPLATYRGRSALARPEQAAEIAVRRAADVHAADDLDVQRLEDGHPVSWRPDADADDLLEVVETEVRHRDGRAWRVRVTRIRLDPRPESCGKGPVDGLTWRPGPPVTAARWR